MTNEQLSIVLAYQLRPTPKQRPRFGRNGTYTPNKTSKYEDAIKVLTKMQYKGRPITGPVSVHLSFHFKRPAKSKYTKPIGCAYGDIDNLIKAVLDALNGIVFRDDNQIVTVTAAKFYNTKDMVVAVVNER